MRTEKAWLDSVRMQFSRNDLAAAQCSLAQGLAEYPYSIELRRALAGVQQRSGQMHEAEATFRGMLAANPGDVVSAFALARLLKEQGRMAAAASALSACFGETSNARDTDLAIRAIELLDDCGRKVDAAALAAHAIEVNPDDPRVHAYAGMLQIQLGEFQRARQHYLFALEHDEHAWEWHVPIGLSSAQCYANLSHPDFILFRNGLQRKGLSEKARSELHFALGKAHGDIGYYAEATRHFREGNAIARRLTKWSRKTWRRAVETRLASKPIIPGLEPSADFTPVFIVGIPRSGTTLLAELLSHYPSVRNRGELPWIAKLAERPALSSAPNRMHLQVAAAAYSAQARQDDAGDALWFIDKQPLNFRYIDLILAMFPHAKIIYCQRDWRDIALSLWMQCFLEDVQGYSYDFNDIALVLNDCEKLMTRWQDLYPDSITAIHYEQIVASPQNVVASIAAWIGFPAMASPTFSTPVASSSAISTASLWQVRQPVSTRSIGRWKNYASFIPELQKLLE